MDIPRPPQRKYKRYAYAGGGLVVVAGLTLALARLEPAAPIVERSAIWTDVVRRGPLVRQVRGTGTLVPERMRLVTPLVGGRVERILVENGTPVKAGTVLIELSNPDIEQAAIEAQNELARLEAQAVIDEAQHEERLLNLAAALENVRADYREAARLASIDQELLSLGIVAPAAAQRSREREQDAARRLELEETRYELQTRTMEAQRTVNRSELQRRREEARIRRERADALRVTAEIDGVVYDINLDIGANVSPSQTVARIVEPGRLKAVLRVSEVQAREVSVGQRVSIDTRAGLIPGSVSRVDPAVRDGTVAVDVTLEGELPAAARPDLSVDGVIDIEDMGEVVHVSRPVFAEANRTIGLFRVDPGGESAARVDVQVGRVSVQAIEILGGLAEGDEVILSDMTRWAEYERVRIR